MDEFRRNRHREYLRFVGEAKAYFMEALGSGGVLLGNLPFQLA